MTQRRIKGEGGHMAPCPYHSTLANSMRLYGPAHPCFTVYEYREDLKP